MHKQNKGSKLKKGERKINRKETQLSQKQIAQISKKLYQKFKKEKRNSKYAPVKEVIVLLGKGLLLTTLFMAPNAGKSLKPFLKETNDWDYWKKYNPAYLKRAIKSLEKQEQVKVDRKKGIVKLTERGKLRILKFALDEIKIKKAKYWDGKWRIVLYDIPAKYRGDQTNFQRILKKLGFCQLQKSVYIIPFECKEEIEYLRSFYGLREYIKVITTEDLEYDSAFKEYFDLN